MDHFLNSIIAITAVAVGILLLKKVFSNKLSPRFHYYLWIILVLRILLLTFPQNYLPTYRALPIIENVKIIEQLPEYENSAAVQEQQAQISADIVFHNYTRPFSVRKNTESFVAYVGFAGAALVFSYFLIVYFLFRIKLNKTACVNDEALSAILSEYKKKLNIKADVTMKKCGSTPMLAGILKPVIVLPEAFDANDVRLMILHELYHLKHHDILLNMAGTVFLCLNWYNPVIWLCHSAFRSDLELLCDSKVLKMTANKKEYASLLLNTSLKSTPVLPMTTCMHSGRNEIKRRIGHIANFSKPNLLWTAVILLAVALLGAGCLSGGVNSANKNDNWAPPFDGLQWGMSETEVMNALSLTEEDVTKYEYYFVTNYELELFGVNKNVAFGFNPGGAERVFTSIVINYSEEDLDTVQREITKKLGEGEPSYYFGESFMDKNLSHIEWKNERIKDNPKYLEIITDVVNTYPSKPRSRYLEDWPEMPLVSYQLNLNQSDHMYGQLTISGFFAVMVDNPDAYKLKE